jgi:hypothetical protein
MWWCEEPHMVTGKNCFSFFSSYEDRLKKINNKKTTTLVTGI